MSLPLGIRAIAHAILDLAKQHQDRIPNARVDWKTNARGELVIALIVPPRYPGEWEDVGGSRARQGGGRRP